MKLTRLHPILLLLLFLHVTTVIFAQRTVRGHVNDLNSNPLAGATIAVKNHNIVTITDSSGKYTISIPEFAGVLVFTYVGATPVEIEVNDKDIIDVSLNVTDNNLSEVVVIGYGTVKKGDVTGSVTSVNLEKIKDIPANSLDALLQGRAAGVQVLNNSQDPGAGAIISIRGNSSINGSNTPLVVVNGFPIGEAGNLFQINPNDIASVEILKDASASAIYGSRGANGVILITTKSAKTGVTDVTVKHQTIVGQFTDPLDIWRDPLLMATLTNEAQTNAGLAPVYTGQYLNGVYYPSLLEIQNGKYPFTDWTKVALRTPVLNNSMISLNSANERTSFNLGANYFNDEGVFIEDNFKKLNVNLGFSYKLFKNFIISANSIAAFAKRNVNNTLEYGRNPLWPVYDSTGAYYLASATDYSHPLLITNSVKNQITSRDFWSSLIADWDIITNLKLRSQLNYKYSISTGNIYWPSFTSADAFAQKGIAQLNQNQTQEILSETYLTYSKVFNNIHNFSAMAGHSYSHEMPKRLYISASGFVNDVLQDENLSAGDPSRRYISNNFPQSKLLSFYSRLNYELNNKYLFTATMRADGSSKFGDNNKWGYFPSGAVAWKMHNENWIRNLGIFSELKLRSSYGISGNQGISPFQTLDRYGLENYWSSGKWQPAIGPGYEVGRTGANDRYIVWGGIRNPDLKWESTRQLDIGADIGLMANKIHLTIDYYHKLTTDLLREKYLPLSSSFDKMWVNDGEILNHGVEFTLQNKIIKTRNWGLNTTLIFTRNRNKVVSLGNTLEGGLSNDYLTGMKYEVTGPAVSLYNQNISIYGVGKPMYVFYGYRTSGIIQQGGDPLFIASDGKDQPGEFQYVDMNGDYQIDSKDRVIIGDPNPDFIASFDISGHWKKLDFSVFFNGMYGNDVIYVGKNFSPRAQAKRWNIDNPTNLYPGLNAARSYLLSSYYVEDGSFLRIQNINAGYTLPSIIRGVKNFRIFLNVLNAFTFTRFNGFDPEVGVDGVYYGGYPKLRKFTFGAEITF